MRLYSPYGLLGDRAKQYCTFKIPNMNVNVNMDNSMASDMDADADMDTGMDVGNDMQIDIDTEVGCVLFPTFSHQTMHGWSNMSSTMTDHGSGCTSLFYCYYS
jgi:hypothetical protein